ncbi:MAG: cupin [Acidimicrobiales bacterium]|nr:cupin [Acidimicrobiales bacterium]
MTSPETTPTTKSGISFFGPPVEAPQLHETDMMSMPEFDPEANDQFMEWALSGGHVVKVLYREGDMSLVWSWFGPNYVLPRHSHSADCLYFVVSGEARLGNRVVPAGAGFFVPAGAPYAYAAGPEGIQILEFRGATSFDMKITEGLPRWDKIVETVRDNSETWREQASTHV